METKVIAMYLPQYHEIPENNAFWGAGYTDWVSVKNAVPLYPGHRQPKVPQGGAYYDLSEPEAIRRQAETAKAYGVGGFGIYHYWFSPEKQLLTKPAEILLQDPTIEIPFLFAWDNISWKRTWSRVKGNAWSPLQDAQKKPGGDEPEILVEYRAGGEKAWKKHFEDLLPYFRDARYIQTDGKPVFLIYHYDETIFRMAEYWDRLARENGFNGIRIIYRFDAARKLPKGKESFLYEPIHTGWGSVTARAYARISGIIREKLKIRKKLRTYDYETIWNRILRRAERGEEPLPGAFAAYDDTPRRGEQGIVIQGSTPERFGRHMEELLKTANRQGKEFVFLTAWNEWGEGAYLEPDEENGTGYLEALKKALEQQNA